MRRNAIEERLAVIRGRVENAAARVDRDPRTVEILPVTKGHPPEAIQSVVASGFARIGENRVPESAEKQERLGGRLGVAWHMIGRLQRNKARRALGLFDVIESVGSLKLARALDRIIEDEGLDSVEILIQVNASGEGAKAGIAMEEAVRDVAQICTLPRLKVSGLMTMAPFAADEQVLRTTFQRVRELAERCREDVVGFEGTVLSMGMSNDFEIAIEEGSTRVRLGTVLLGER